MALTTQINHSTTLSTTAAATSLSPSGAGVLTSNPFDQMVTLMASGNLRVQAESQRSMVAFNQFADEMRKNFTAIVAENNKLKAAMINLESHNKSLTALNDARINDLQKQINTSKLTNESLQKQITKMKEEKMIEEFNASLGKLQNDAKNWIKTALRASQWLSANSGWAISVLEMRNANVSLLKKDDSYDQLIKDIKTHLLKKPKPAKGLAALAPKRTWISGCLPLVQRIVGLQPFQAICVIQ